MVLSKIDKWIIGWAVTFVTLLVVVFAARRLKSNPRMMARINKFSPRRLFRRTPTNRLQYGPISHLPRPRPHSFAGVSNDGPILGRRASDLEGLSYEATPIEGGLRIASTGDVGNSRLIRVGGVRHRPTGINDIPRHRPNSRQTNGLGMRTSIGDVDTMPSLISTLIRKRRRRASISRDESLTSDDTRTVTDGGEIEYRSFEIDGPIRRHRSTNKRHRVYSNRRYQNIRAEIKKND